MYCDNKSTIATIKEGGNFNHNCHYIVRSNFVKSYIDKKYFDLEYVSGKTNVADGLTNPLGFILFDKFLKALDFE